MGERSFVVSLEKVFEKPRAQRAQKEVNHLKKFLKKNLRADEKHIIVSQKINEFLWSNGIEHIPRKIEIKAVLEEGIVRAFLKGEKIEKKEEKEKPEKEEKKETKKQKEIEEKRREKKEKERAAEKTAIKRGTQ